MARRGSRARQRDATHIATPHSVLSTPNILPSLRALDRARALSSTYEDRRQWHPTKTRYVLARPLRARPLLKQKITSPGVGKAALTTKHVFTTPSIAPVCVRRKTRREVIFALQKTGKGARSKRKRNEYTNIKC